MKAKQWLYALIPKTPLYVYFYLFISFQIHNNIKDYERNLCDLINFILQDAPFEKPRMQENI